MTTMLDRAPEAASQIAPEIVAFVEPSDAQMSAWMNTAQGTLAEARAEAVLTAFDPDSRYALSGMTTDQVAHEITPLFQNPEDRRSPADHAPFTGPDQAQAIQQTIMRDLARLPQDELNAVYNRIGVMAGAGFDRTAAHALALSEQLTTDFRYGKNAGLLIKLSQLAKENESIY